MMTTKQTLDIKQKRNLDRLIDEATEMALDANLKAINVLKSTINQVAPAFISFQTTGKFPSIDLIGLIAKNTLALYIALSKQKEV